MKDRVKGYIKNLVKILKKPEMAILPANIAFYLILAIIPLLTIVVLIASSFDISIDLVADLVKSILPGEAGTTVVSVISGKGFDSNVGIFNITAFIIASNGMRAIINASDAIYKIKNNDFLKKIISSFILLFIIIILFVFMLVVPIFGNNILSLMHHAKILENYADEVIVLFNIVKWPITLFIIYFNIKLIYTIAPSQNIKSSETTYGAAFTTIIWLIATIIFKFYLTYFARYDILYGNLSSLIIMMVWVYFLSYIFVLGMAINVQQHKTEVTPVTIPESKLAKETKKDELVEEVVVKPQSKNKAKKKNAEEKKIPKKEPSKKASSNKEENKKNNKPKNIPE